MPPCDDLWAVVLYDDADLDIVDVLPTMYTTRGEALRAAASAGGGYRLFPMTAAEIAWFVARGGSGGRVFVRQEQPAEEALMATAAGAVRKRGLVGR
jgi:hypothetical protein